MAHLVGTGHQGKTITISASGTIDYPTDWELDSADDVEIVLIEGAGSVDAGSKTTTGFDFTVDAGPCIVRAEPLRTNAVRHIA